MDTNIAVPGLPEAPPQSMQPTPPTQPKRRSNLRPYSNEHTLFVIMAVISAFGWIGLTLATVGTIWIFMLFAYLFGLAAFSYFISYVRGNGVRVTAEQFPELHARFLSCCQTVGMPKDPEFYLLSGNGTLNAFATRFLHRYYVVLLTDIVDALEDDPEALNFYIGHELGHIAQRHLVHHWWLVFARWIPLLGTAYSRAREYTCDQYGLLCTSDKRNAEHAMAVLAAGSRLWKTMSTEAYIAQTKQTGGFWMSLNELTSDYPWLCKRVERIHTDKPNPPRRNIFAWIFATFIPNTGFGLIGSMVIYSYLMIFIAVAAIPIYKAHAEQARIDAERVQYATTREQINKVHTAAMEAAKAINHVIETKDEMPNTLEEIGFKNTNPLISAISYDAEMGQIRVTPASPLDQTELILDFSLTKDGSLNWTCTANTELPETAMPDNCPKVNPPTPDEPEETQPPRLNEMLKKLLT